jgi:two-component system, LytTR family, response regulator
VTDAARVAAQDSYRAVIVDDERIARAGLRAMLSRHPQLRVVGEARDGEEAAAIIRDLRPHVVFLDIQMPGRDGFGVIRELAATGRPPAIVFVTAHSTRALEAYDVDAVDYLHKPFSDARLARTVQRVLRHLRGSRGAAEAPRTERLLLRTADGAVFVDPGDIRRVCVEANYLRVFAGASEYVVRRTMADLAHELRHAGFIRISRSELVNAARVRVVHRRPGGRYEVVLDGGQSLMSSRRYRRDIRAAIPDLG